MTRVLVAVAVAALVVLAGCSGAPATQPTNDEPAPSTNDTTAVDSDGPDLERVTVPSSLVPPGANQRSITNARSLLIANLQALPDMEYDAELTHSKIYAQGELDTAGTVQYDLTDANETYTSTRTLVEAGETTVNDAYVDPEAVFLRDQNATGTTYRYGKGPVPLRLREYAQPRHPSASVLFLYMQLSTGMQATGFDTVNGQKVVEYQSKGVNDSKLATLPRLGAPNGTVEAFSLTMYVDSDGVVHRASGSMALERENGEARERSLSYRLTQVGDVTVNEPDWTNELPRLEGSLEADNRLLAVENTGNATLENYSVSVVGNVTGDVSVNGSFEPGDTAYMYVTGSENGTVLHVEETRPDVPAEARELPRRGRSVALFESPTYQLDFGVFENTSNASESVTAPATDDGRETVRAPDDGLLDAHHGLASPAVPIRVRG